jgi:hypothetical protein
MAIVQRAQCRNESDALAPAPRLSERDAERLDALYDLHDDIRRLGLEAVIVVGIASRAHLIAEA